jgi:hypothetical protein
VDIFTREGDYYYCLRADRTAGRDLHGPIRSCFYGARTGKRSDRYSDASMALLTTHL